MSDAARIAASLSEAQRRALLAAEPATGTKAPLFVPIYRDMGKLAASLRQIKLARLCVRGTVLTKGGLAVRAELEKGR